MAQRNKGTKKYLYSQAALAKVWRAKMLDAIMKNTLLSLPAFLFTQKWVVDCRAVGRGLPALKYLSRYLYRGVLPDKDIVDINGDQVTFRYIDSQTNQFATRSLPTGSFLILILQHVLPKGLQRVRAFLFIKRGLLHGSAKKKRHSIALILLQMSHKMLPVEAKEKQEVIRFCSFCGNRFMICTGIIRPK